MEPADPAQLQLKLGQQEAMLKSQQQQLLAVMHCVQTMTHQMASLSTTVQAAHPSPDPWTASAPAPTDLGSATLPLAPSLGIREHRLPPSERYDGSPGDCKELPNPVPAHLQPATQFLSC